MIKEVYLVASGDLRLSRQPDLLAGTKGNGEQPARGIDRLGVKVTRAHPFDKDKGHGFIDSQKNGYAGLSGFGLT